MEKIRICWADHIKEVYPEEVYPSSFPTVESISDFIKKCVAKAETGTIDKVVYAFLSLKTLWENYTPLQLIKKEDAESYNDFVHGYRLSKLFIKKYISNGAAKEIPVGKLKLRISTKHIIKIKDFTKIQRDIIKEREGMLLRALLPAINKRVKAGIVDLEGLEIIEKEEILME